MPMMPAAQSEVPHVALLKTEACELSLKKKPIVSVSRLTRRVKIGAMRPGRDATRARGGRRGRRRGRHAVTGEGYRRRSLS